MSDTPPLDNFYVGWSSDGRTYQLLGMYEANNAKDAVSEASVNHGQDGRYLVMPNDKVTLFDVTFEKVPQMTKVAQQDSVPTDPTDSTPI